MGCQEGSATLSAEKHHLANLPQTPQRLLSPSRRTSSLAFHVGKRSLRPQHNECFDQPTQAVGSLPKLNPTNTGKDRKSPSSLAHEIPSPGHVAQMQRIFQVARANLHRDIFAASSPVGSIESRMKLDATIVTNSSARPRTQDCDASCGDEEISWRYSTAPDRIAQSSVDVREPLPSPTLPEVVFCPGLSSEGAAEPLSSGFRPPDVVDGLDGKCHTPLDALQPDKSSESIPNDIDPSHVSYMAGPASKEAALYEQMTKLQVSTNNPKKTEGFGSNVAESTSCGSGVESTIVAPSSPQSSDIYMSPSAEAAAESAKVKRRLLKAFVYSAQHEQGVGNVTEQRNEFIQSSTARANLDICTGTSFALNREEIRLGTTTPMTGSQATLLSEKPVTEYFNQALPHPGASRATSTGSPMPFPSRRPRANIIATSSNSPREGYHIASTYHNNMDEHFQPGWYYAQEIPIYHSRPPLRPMYSFSTAASKIVGSDQAPASRIRDSYKTDTLTALAKPASRFRKNGIGADVVPRGMGRYYTRPISSIRTSSAHSRPSSRQTHAGTTDVRFRSSPPREPSSDQFEPYRRKRALDDNFIKVQDTQEYPQHQLRLGGDVSMFNAGNQADGAVRVNVFGTDTPGALRNAREGIRELSPNIQVYRKGTQEYTHLHKKRRPSYWDNDLKEVRESPASRGGVNSPVSTKASMQAEFEIASTRDTDLDMDEEILSVDAHRESMSLDGWLEVAPFHSTASYQSDDGRSRLDTIT